MSEERKDQLPIEIRENLIQVNNLQNGDSVLLQPGKNLYFKLNGEKIEGSVYLTCSDQLEVITEYGLEPLLDYDLMISEDAMEAILKITSRPGLTYKLRPELKEDCIIIEAVQETVQPEPLEYEDIKELLKSRGVVYGVKEETIKNIVNSIPEDGFYLVAEGLAPTPPQDAWIEYLIPVQQRNKQRTPQDWNKYIVKAGQILARKHPIQGLGTKGIDVFGSFVEPEMPKDVAILCGTGVELSKDGLFALAAIDGRAMLIKNRLYVKPILEITEDLTGQNEPIVFPGDVIVHGSVLDGGAIDATGKIVVKGNVFHGDLTSGGEVKIQGNVMNSFVRAGAAKLNVDKAFQFLQQAIKETKKLLLAVNHLKNYLHENDSNKRDPLFFKLLLKERFNSLPKILESAIKELTKTQAVEPLFTPLILKELYTLSSYLKNPVAVDIVKSIEFILKSLEDPTQELDKFKEGMEFNNADISCKYAQYSVLQATGTVTITDKGSYMSSIEALNNVNLLGPGGNVLGGMIKTNRFLKAAKIGSSLEVKTKIIVQNKKWIKALQIYPGTSIVEARPNPKKKIS